MAFAGTGKIWMNGTLVDWADAKIHVASHVIHYGSGVFEGTRCYDTRKGPAVLRLDSGATVQLPLPYDGCLLGHDPGFEDKLFILRQLWEIHRRWPRA